MGNTPIGFPVRWRGSQRKQNPRNRMVSGIGAARQIRTADLVITNDALYRLSYSSISFQTAFVL